jgi:NarL family two-component system response regulator YdfI
VGSSTTIKDKEKKEMSYPAGNLLLKSDDRIQKESNQVERVELPHIMLIDAHLLMRKALQRVVTTFFHSAYATSGSTVSDALTMIEKSTVYTIILGPSIPISDCLRLLLQLNEQQLLYRIITIQHALQPETAHMLIEWGVDGILDESACEQDVARAIEMASHTKIFLSRAVYTLLTTSKPGALNYLTRREMQVLLRLKSAESNFRIAHGLGLKEKTIEKYLSNIYDKLNIHSRAEALLYLQRICL